MSSLIASGFRALDMGLAERNTYLLERWQGVSEYRSALGSYEKGKRRECNRCREMRWGRNEARFARANL
jgi:hypothetical protein